MSNFNKNGGVDWIHIISNSVIIIYLTSPQDLIDSLFVDFIIRITLIKYYFDLYFHQCLLIIKSFVIRISTS